MNLPTLDAHSHLLPRWTSQEVSQAGALLSMTLSLDEAEMMANREEPLVAWGIGCHPRFVHAQKCFQVDRFRTCLDRFAVVGEMGLDTGAAVPMDLQQKIFRQVLEAVAEKPRLVSIHSYLATRQVLDALHETPTAFPVLHWWKGTDEQTREAVQLGCYFSIHQTIARWTRFRRIVPLERILIETDHGYGDPPAIIPHQIALVEHLVAQNYSIPAAEVRQVAWRNFAHIIRQTGVMHLLPPSFTDLVLTVV